MKQFADNNFKFDENGRKLSERVENTVGKGEIACYEQFLLFPQYYQKVCFTGASKRVVVWEWVKQVANTVGKGEIARYKRFLLYPQCFQKTCTADTEKPGLVWVRVNELLVAIHVPLIFF